MILRLVMTVCLGLIFDLYGEEEADEDEYDDPAVCKGTTVVTGTLRSLPPLSARFGRCCTRVDDAEVTVLAAGWASFFTWVVVVVVVVVVSTSCLAIGASATGVAKSIGVMSGSMIPCESLCFTSRDIFAAVAVVDGAFGVSV